MFDKFKTYVGKNNFLYENLEDEASKQILIEITSYRILGNKFIKLSTNNNEWRKNVEELKATEIKDDFIKSSAFILKKC